MHLLCAWLQVESLRHQLAKMKEITQKAQSTWDKFRKERDFHRMHHKRVVQEKGKLTVDLKRLRKHLESYDPTIQELQVRAHWKEVSQSLKLFSFRFVTHRVQFSELLRAYLSIFDQFSFSYHFFSSVKLAQVRRGDEGKDVDAPRARPDEGAGSHTGGHGEGTHRQKRARSTARPHAEIAQTGTVRVELTLAV